MSEGGPGRRFHLRLRNCRLAIGDVVSQGVVEQHHLLRDYSDLRAEGSHGNIADVKAIYQ